MIRDEQGPVPALWYALLALVVVLIAVTGWLGYLVYPRLGLPAVQGAALLALAAGAGIASFFSPCSFPLLATILSRDLNERGVGRDRVASALRSAAALSVGAAAFLVLVGLGIAAGAGAFFQSVGFGSAPARAIRFVVGALLIGLGLIQSGVIPIDAFHAIAVVARPLQRGQAKLRRANAAAGYVLFGFGYLLAGFG